MQYGEATCFPFYTLYFPPQVLTKIITEGEFFFLGRVVRGNMFEKMVFKTKGRREQDGGGVGGRGVHLSPWIHREYTFRHRSACRTPAESELEDLTSGKECIEP